MRILTITRFTMLFALIVGTLFALNGQAKFTAKNNISLAVSGTSTMHDWVMKSGTGDCNATLVEDAKGNLTDLTTLNFTVSAKSLKSGKDGMDKNAYKALKTDKAPNITASLKSATISTKDNKNYTIKAVIKLTIAGKTVETDLTAQAKRINDNSYAVKGEKNISMKDYGVEAPSFMLGAVKTGNDVVLSFDAVLNR
ncbi:MAG: YceI family protein [Saprospiraceae bacterium]|nr:YceI family protein [Saprospiraceae bacterium]